jgi:hypothetical protein
MEISSQMTYHSVTKVNGVTSKSSQIATFLVVNPMIATKRSLAKASIDPEFTSLLDSEDLEGMSTDHGWTSNGWLSLFDFFKNPDCS